MLAGLAPVLAIRRIDLNDALKEGARLAGAGNHRQSMRSALVVAEVAITLVLAFGSGLLLRSLAAAQSVDPGFDTANLLTFALDLPGKSYPTAASTRQFYTTLADRLRLVPGSPRRQFRLLSATHGRLRRLVLLHCGAARSGSRSGAHRDLQSRRARLLSHDWASRFARGANSTTPTAPTV